MKSRASADSSERGYRGSEGARMPRRPEHKTHREGEGNTCVLTARLQYPAANVACRCSVAGRRQSRLPALVVHHAACLSGHPDSRCSPLSTSLARSRTPGQTSLDFSCVSGWILCCTAVGERVTLAMAGKLCAALTVCWVVVLAPPTLAEVRSRLLQGTRVLLSQRRRR